MGLFEGAKKNFGFGCMRLPMLESGEVNYIEFSQMIDEFIDAGFNYFDTAKGYLGGKSEIALRDCLVNRYPRTSYMLADKLSFNFFEKEEEILPLFETQLSSCGVEYFDAYLMHAMNGERYKKYVACNAFFIASQLKKQGKIKHIGMSFHDKADVLDMILTEQPEIEFVQIQFNYRDYDHPGVQSSKCYDVCRKHGKAIIVMEPVRGGSLVNLPDSAKKILDVQGSGSYASYAIRFCAGFDGIEMVLSGMSNIDQMRDNLSYMTDFKPLNDDEIDAISRVQGLLKLRETIPCTACRYCVDGCPMNIPIPEIFAEMNKKQQDEAWGADSYYNIFANNSGTPNSCLECGKCEISCPQNIEIRKLLKAVTKEFE